MTCFFCKGEMKPSTTIHTVQLENCVVVIKNVPCMKCEQCGEVVKGFKRCRVCIGILRAQEVARLYEPVARFKLLFYRKLFQLIADTCDALVKKINGAHIDY